MSLCDIQYEYRVNTLDFMFAISNGKLSLHCAVLNSSNALKKSTTSISATNTSSTIMHTFTSKSNHCLN